MRTSRTPCGVQIPLLKDAVLALAERLWETIVVSDIPITEVKLQTLLLWLTPMGPRTTIEVWDESRGAKVLNLWITSASRAAMRGTSTTISTGGVSHTSGWSLGMSHHTTEIEVVSFRRGDWEDALLQHARRVLH